MYFMTLDSRINCFQPINCLIFKYFLILKMKIIYMYLFMSDYGIFSLTRHVFSCWR